jgi:hypothetical protein
LRCQAAKTLESHPVGGGKLAQGSKDEILEPAPVEDIGNRGGGAEKQPYSGGPFRSRGTPKVGRGRVSTSRVMNYDVVMTFYYFAISSELKTFTS